MQIPLIWRFLETHMTRTPHHSKKKKSAVHGLPLTQAAVDGFFIIWYVHIGRYASFVHNSLVVMVIAFSMPFGYTCLAISGKENSTMPATRNLCAQLPLDLHQRVCEAREESGLTTAQYITNLLLEYYEMKENGGNAAMTNGKNRTLAFQIDEELFQRIKAHLERESARLGRKVTQREFVLNAIIGVLNMSEPMDVDEAGVSPCEAGSEDGSAQPQEEDTPAALSA
mgnify:CR=1 FL=1